jgi:hypothetical protein
MSAAKAQRARRETVVLTREAVEAILVGHMGWEPEDADIFWRMARRETSAPGTVAELLERSFQRAFGQNQ